MLLYIVINHTNVSFHGMTLMYMHLHSFGSLVRSETSGIIFNNEMDNFNIPGKLRYEVEPKANFIAPQKRPLSASAPTIMLNKDGSIKMVIGASGGIMIPSALAQVIKVSLPVATYSNRWQYSFKVRVGDLWKSPHEQQCHGTQDNKFTIN